MADPIICCARCGLRIPAPAPLPGGLRHVRVCTACHGRIVCEQGELSGPDDRADPDEWGGLPPGPWQ